MHDFVARIGHELGRANAKDSGGSDLYYFILLMTYDLYSDFKLI